VAYTTRAGQPPDKPELLRRLRLHDLKAIFRARYGPVLPDDDAGHSDLHDLLCVVSTAPNAADIKMRYAIETLAPWPWLTPEATDELIDVINRTPLHQRELSRQELGRRQNVTNELRERLGLRQIWPRDMTVAEMEQYRKARRKAKQARYRRNKGSKPRAQYEANSLNKTKPWIAAGVSRRTWYRRKVGTSPLPKQTGPRSTEVFASIVRSGLHIGGWTGASLALKALLLTWHKSVACT
jgi:hypothetical protein